ncbi:BNR repeat-containing protein [Paenibacillus sp. CC-CFT747]|nr:BNR repeat-containing protein [Paenibacillus sp. CC-CFT747]
MAGSYDHQTGQITSVMLKHGLQKDDHANPAIHIDEEGVVTVYYSAHNGDHMYYRKSLSPEDISGWGQERKLDVNTEGRFGFTYPNPVYLGLEDKQFLFWRGGDFKPNYSLCGQEGEWEPARTLIQGNGARPYIKYATDSTEKIYFAFTDGHPNVEPTNSIYCAYYSQGSTFQVDGTPIKDISHLPLNPAEVHAVYDAKQLGGKTWIWDIALDSQNQPVVVYVVFNKDEDHRYWYSRWDGAKWRHVEICEAGPWFPETPPGAIETEPYYSGGLILDHHDPSHVYLSRCVEGVFEIEHWYTPDQGKPGRGRPSRKNRPGIM